MPSAPSLRFAALVSVLAVLAFGLGRLVRAAGPSTTLAPRSTVAPGPAGTSLSPVKPAESALSATAADSASFAARAASLHGTLAAEDERQRVLEEWAQTDPAAALAFARGELRGERQARALAALLAVWGRNDPAASWTWVAREMPGAVHHFDTLLEVFGQRSTALARRYAAEYATAHPEAAVEVNLAALMGVAYRGDFTGARGYIEATAAADPSVRANLTHFLAGQWARFDPAAARDWVLTLPDSKIRARALAGVSESWAEIDPPGAAAFAASLPDGPSRSLALSQAVTKWAQEDAEAAHNWIVQGNSSGDFDAAVHAIATDLPFMHREPAHALAWATGIVDERLRIESLRTVLFNWAATDRPAALAALAATPDLSGAQRDALLAHLPGARQP